MPNAKDKKKLSEQVELALTPTPRNIKKFLDLLASNTRSTLNAFTAKPEILQSVPPNKIPSLALAEAYYKTRYPYQASAHLRPSPFVRTSPAHIESAAPSTSYRPPNLDDLKYALTGQSQGGVSGPIATPGKSGLLQINPRARSVNENPLATMGVMAHEGTHATDAYRIGRGTSSVSPYDFVPDTLTLPQWISDLNKRTNAARRLVRASGAKHLNADKKIGTLPLTEFIDKLAPPKVGVSPDFLLAARRAHVPGKKGNYTIPTTNFAKYKDSPVEQRANKAAATAQNALLMDMRRNPEVADAFEAALRSGEIFAKHAEALKATRPK